MTERTESNGACEEWPDKPKKAPSFVSLATLRAIGPFYHVRARNASMTAVGFRWST